MVDASRTQKLGFISDHETKIDLLRNKAIATTILDIIAGSGTQPLTIGVHGYWGAGKSSVLEMIADHDFEDEKTLVIRFNGWQFEGFEDAKIALIEGIIDQLIANKTIYNKAKDQILDVVKRIDWLKAAKKAGGLAFTVATGLPSPDQALELTKFAIGKVAGGEWATPENIAAATEGVKGYLKEAEDKPTVAKNIREFNSAFKLLIEKAEIDRLIVLVDDLDRCLPETAIETLEAIRLFVLLPRTAFVIGADETMIRYAVTKHFPDLPAGAANQDYPRAYLEKLIQVPFRIPAMGEAETKTYLTLLAVGSIVGENSEEFNSLLEKAEDYMSTPWLQKSIGDIDVSNSLGAMYTSEVVSAVSMMAQISAVLASGTKGNPRNVKRFLNSLTLRLAVAEARGFQNVIESQILAKIMLAEQFFPDIFEEIAREVGTNPDGVSSSLERLEERCSKTAAPNENLSPDDSEVSDSDNTVTTSTEQIHEPRIDAWMVQPNILPWARQKPKIGTKDLRPYLFVVNDVKNFAIMTAALDARLLTLVEKLSKDDLAAASVLPSVAALVPEDKMLVFEELRAIVLKTTDWDRKPAAITGMILFLTKVSEFESRYLELLEQLPAEKLGSWAAAGHDRAVKTPDGKTRLSKIVEGWKTTGSESLKSMIQADGGR
ncbi:Qat anti-phage system ATPase QatA [Pseudochrobactrum asaccharolyticum]|uniref:Putative KAP-like P-loop ATPase n=2 Tax=Brucellaceae TaxID=118882 RepID=A0A366E4G8_9HYPH|nr:Qat anti-phage system ATPase QatA [Pseudochrobactrum asaccharolyticum]MBX8802036.1 NTPase KAP [Ochrobactrum sp. MR28]MBX8817681.1 NTPase KAP [Ochrobactrum sp. MR31]RBO97260.1 putative KAP-like P-loop ATPase [Pseudochrobactrum asaccharolyticum]